MTKLQEELKEALDVFSETIDMEWQEVVTVVNKLREAIISGEEHYDASFPPEIERAFDHGANCTAWIYTRLEVNTKRKTGTKIRKAMGYSG